MIGDMQHKRSESPRITQHAADRYRQRVEDISSVEAARRLAFLASDATRRPTPRRWTTVESKPGILFLYPHSDPDVCLIVKNDTVVTVLSRPVCSSWRKNQLDLTERRRRRDPYHRPSPGTPLEAA